MQRLIWISFEAPLCLKGIKSNSQNHIKKSHKDMAATFLLMFPLSWQENKAGVTNKIIGRWDLFLCQVFLMITFDNAWISLFRCVLYFLVIPLVQGFFSNIFFSECFILCTFMPVCAQVSWRHFLVLWVSALKAPRPLWRQIF